MTRRWQGAPLAALVAAALAGATLAGAGAARADCPPAPDPVTGLSFDSRYADGDATRSDLDPEAAAAAGDALEPLEDFLRDLARAADAAIPAGDAAAADCILAQLRTWAAADALADLGSDTAALTIGSRLAGLSIVVWRVAPLATDTEALDAVGAWLDRRLIDQIAFWETGAPPGARSGNLRAWAALAAAARAASGGDARLRLWAGASAAYVLCTAGPDGSLPQEMSRGSLALHYQLHAVAPLVVTAAILQAEGIDLAPLCDSALDRVVGFALADLDSGAATQALTGQVQSYFDGGDTLEPFQIAWIEAYLRLPGATHAATAEARIADLRPLAYSKLGGDQSLIWGD